MCRERRVKEFKAKSAEQALSSLMRQCARAERSSGDAMRLMSRWGVEPSSRVAILKRLIDDKFIDDRRYAEAYIREKLNLSGWGTRKISSALRLKGISSEIVNELLSDLDRDSLESRLCERLRRKMSSIKYTTNYELKSKLTRYGLSLGYDYDMVLDVVPTLLKDDYEE